MKKLFRYLAAALLVGTSFAAASCSDEEPTPPTPPTPNFPTPLEQQTVLPGNPFSFEIKPNMDWKISIPEEASKWFYLLDESGTEVLVRRGTAVVGDQSITIKGGAKNGEPFDEAPTVDVTMSMGNPEETKVIASFKIEQKERELKLYSALTDETGEYVYNEDEGSELDYSYEAEGKTEGSVKLEKHGAFYSARLLVESNVAWTLSVPEWVDVRVNAEAATTGTAGKSEVELRANDIKMPLEGAADVACQFVDQNKTDEKLAQISLSMDNLTDVCEHDLPKEALFSPRGNYLASTTTFGASLNGFITAPKGAQIIAIAQDFWGDYAQCSWVTPKIAEWEGEDKIQTRDVSITVDPQGAGWDASERQAEIYVLPATLKDVTADDLLANIEEYKEKYLVTTITQEASTYLLNRQNSKAMKEQGVKFELGTTWFDSTLEYCDWMQNDNGLYYKLTYTKEYSADGGALDIGPMPDGGPKNYTSYKIYGYTAEDANDILPNDKKWITLQETRNAETDVVESFTVQMNFDEEYVQNHGNWSMKYAFVVFYDETNTAIATLECEYNENASIGGDTGALSFAYPNEAASMDDSTLEQLQAGDPDYDKYAAAYADLTPSVYRVTFTKPNPTMSGIKGLPDYGQWCEVIDGVDWLSPDVGETVSFSDKTNSGKSAKGACIFYSGGTEINADGKVVDPQGPAVIVVVNFVLE